LVKDGIIVPKPEVPVPTVPMDYGWARVNIIYLLILFIYHDPFSLLRRKIIIVNKL